MNPSDPTRVLSALQSAQEWMLVLAADGSVMWASDPCAAAVGLTPRELIGRPLSTLRVALRWVDDAPAYLEKARATAAPVRFTALGGGLAGPRAFDFVLTAVNPPSPGGGASFVVVGRDVTEHQQQFALLREHEEFFRLIFEHGALGIIILSPDARILRVNARYAQFIGRAEADICGKRLGDLSNPEDSAKEWVLLEQLQRGDFESYEFEKRLTRSDGNEVWVRVKRTAVRDREGHIRYLVGLAEDIDARKRSEADHRAMEQRLQERHKLESLGVLAGGIAHDLNNLLVPIMGNAELVMDELPRFGPQRHAMQEILRAAERAADLAHQMLAVSGRGHAVLEPVDLSALVKEMQPALRASVPRQLPLSTDLARGLPPVSVDPIQARQVVFNLLHNASEACGPDADGVRVETGSERLDRTKLESLFLPGEAAEGDYVFVRVRDRGCGMDEETRAQVFDPFFTTKGPGRGLGLAAVVGIVRGHRGAIHVDSAPGVGTTVTVYFPVATQPTVAPVDRVESTAKPAAPPQCVLIVEDDEAVRGLAARTLERAGYMLLTAGTGAEAVETVRVEPSIACVLLDLRMPGFDGVKACERLKALRPDLPLVVMSGHLDATLTSQIAPYASVVLPKPFSPRALRDAVQTAIAARTGT